MKKILIVNDHLTAKGGADKVALWQFKEIASRAGESNVKYFSINDINHGEYDFTPANILNNLFNLRVFFRLRHILKDFKPDEVIVHSWTKQISSIIFLALRSTNVSVICHDYFLSCPNGGLYNFQKNTICNLRGGGASCLITQCDKENYGFKIYRIIRFWIQSILIHFCKPRLYTLNQIQSRLLTSFADKKEYKNAIDAVVVNDELGTDVVFVGRPDPEKGLSDLLHLKSKTLLNVVLYGPAPHEVPVKLASCARGWVDSGTLARQSLNFRVCIFPSVWYEADPLVPWEMMSRGVPVVSRSQNVFGQWLKNHCPDLVYDNPHELELIVERFSADDYAKDMSKRVLVLAEAERQSRLADIELFFNDVLR